MATPIERLEDIEDINDRTLVKLLQDLIKIPSWVPQDPPEARLTQNENEVVDFLEAWIKTNTHLKVERQKLEGGRFNLIASSGEPDLVFLGHTDTVAPSDDSPYGQLDAEIHEGRVWGRGATDMKSGLASLINALSLSPTAKNVWLMFYADEEYDFLGMKALIKDYAYIRPKLIVSSDGGDLSIGHGCRGLIEFRAQIQGKTGHAAKGNGLNAIEGAFQGISDLKRHLRKYKHPVMGDTSINLAYMLGGKRKSGGSSFQRDGRLGEVEQEGNVIPDVAEYVVDIRPSSPDVTAEKIIKELENTAVGNGYTFLGASLRHQLGAWYTELNEIEEYLELAKEATGKISVEKPGESGYLDLQMLWDATGRPPSFMFGGGNGNTAHRPNENISIENLIMERNFFMKVLQHNMSK